MKDLLLVTAFLLILAAAVATYQYITAQQQAQHLEPSLPEKEVSGPLSQAPLIRHPIPQAPLTIEPELESSNTAEQVEVENTETLQSPEEIQLLPALDESDQPLLESLYAVIESKLFQSLFNPHAIVRRFVTTIDNLSRKTMPRKYLSILPVEGQFIVRSEGNLLFLDEANYNRYRPLISVLETLDLEKLVSIYIHFYPLFQQAYEDLGYPSAYFNDRLIEVIDLMLTTPDILAPVKLVRPRILYQYANQELESLSSGQKILIRMGPDNAGKVKQKLLTIRKLLLQ